MQFRAQGPLRFIGSQIQECPQMLGATGSVCQGRCCGLARQEPTHYGQAQSDQAAPGHVSGLAALQPRLPQ